MMANSQGGAGADPPEGQRPSRGIWQTIANQPLVVQVVGGAIATLLAAAIMTFIGVLVAYVTANAGQPEKGRHSGGGATTTNPKVAETGVPHPKPSPSHSIVYLRKPLSLKVVTNCFGGTVLVDLDVPKVFMGYQGDGGDISYDACGPDEIPTLTSEGSKGPVISQHESPDFATCSDELDGSAGKSNLTNPRADMNICLSTNRERIVLLRVDSISNVGDMRVTVTAWESS